MLLLKTLYLQLAFYFVGYFLLNCKSNAEKHFTGRAAFFHNKTIDVDHMSANASSC